MTHDPLNDLMLNGLDQWNATAGTYSLDGTYIPDGTYVRLSDLPDLIARIREDAYQKGRDHGWALNAECCGSCPGECAQQVALRQMKEEGLV